MYASVSGNIYENAYFLYVGKTLKLAELNILSVLIFDFGSPINVIAV